MSAVENYQEGGEDSSALYWKLKRVTLFVGENVQIMEIYEEISHYKCNFRNTWVKKNPNFSQWGLSLLFVIAKMFLELAFFLDTSVLKNSLLHAWSTTIAGWKRKLLGFEPAKNSLFQWFHTLKSPYFKVYFSFTWHLESPYTDLLQFKHKCSCLLPTNLKKTIYQAGAVIEKHGY